MSLDVIPYTKEEKYRLDGRVKLDPQTKKKIRELYKTTDASQRDLARMFLVSRRLIQFCISPQKLSDQKKLFRERQAGGRYYSKEKQRIYMQRHRLKKRLEQKTTAKYHKKSYEEIQKKLNSLY